MNTQPNQRIENNAQGAREKSFLRCPGKDCDFAMSCGMWISNGRQLPLGHKDIESPGNMCGTSRMEAYEPVDFVDQ